MRTYVGPNRSGAVASASAPSVVARACSRTAGCLNGAPNRSRRFGYYRNDYRPPPPNNYRRAPPALPNMEGERMLWSIMGANAFVFACWHALDPRLMQQNFLVSEESVYAGRVHTIVTSAFSHYNLGHLGANMLALYYFGRDLSRIFGPKYLEPRDEAASPRARRTWRGVGGSGSDGGPGVGGSSRSAPVDGWKTPRGT